jgi:hypothetical protein
MWTIRAINTGDPRQSPALILAEAVRGRAGLKRAGQPGPTSLVQPAG